jgi:hypothetical protein
VNHEQRYQHEDICPYLPIECLAGNGKDSVAKCGWRGKKTELYDHVVLAHGLHLVHVGPTMEDVEGGGFDRCSMKIMLLCALEELFWLTVKHDLENNTRLEAVQYIGSRSRATHFEYQHELQSIDGRTRISFVSATRTCFEDVNAIISAKFCFHTDLYFFRSLFLNSHKRIPGYKLTLRKVLFP